ncbi:MAG: hypothetical protein GX597_10975, partial [Anaerolineaceae bacterium]|nr:hypothetical protein [Anaerolineaceae bacterium]
MGWDLSQGLTVGETGSVGEMASVGSIVGVREGADVGAAGGSGVNSTV